MILNAIQIAGGIIGLIIVCVTTTLAVTGWTNRFATKKLLSDKISKMEDDIDAREKKQSELLEALAKTLQENTLALTNMRVIETTLAHITARINAIDHRCNNHMNSRRDPL